MLLSIENIKNHKDYEWLSKFSSSDWYELWDSERTLFWEHINQITDKTVAGTISFEDAIYPLECRWEALSSVLNHVYALKYLLGSTFSSLYVRLCQDISQLAWSCTEHRKFNLLIKRFHSLRLKKTHRLILEKAVWASCISFESHQNRKKKKSLEKRQEDLVELFDERLKKAFESAELYVPYDASGLDQINKEILFRAEERAASLGFAGYVFNAETDEYYSLMSHCSNRDLRRKMYRLKVSSASDLARKDQDTSEIIKKTLRLRGDEAKSVGHDSYASYMLTGNMLDEPDKVKNFLESIIKIIRPQAISQREELKSYFKSSLGGGRLEPWDYRYVKWHMLKNRFKDKGWLSKAFEVKRAVHACFEYLCKKMALRYIANTSSTAPYVISYHFYKSNSFIGSIDVVPFSIGNLNDADASPFCIDLTSNTPQFTAKSIVFAQALKNKSGKNYLSLDDLANLMHELGHGFQNLLSKPGNHTLNLNSVEKDSLEIHSLLFERLTLREDFLYQVARKNGRRLYKKDISLIQEHYFAHNEAVLLGQLLNALVDIEIHHSYNPKGKKPAWEVLYRKRIELGMDIPKSYSRHLNHLRTFSGVYPCNDYAYYWNEAIASAIHRDVLGEKGELSSKKFKMYIKKMIEPAALKSTSLLLKALLGRPPNANDVIANRQVNV